jgi:hypothetical protein
MVMQTAVKIMATVFQNDGGVLILDFLPSVITVNTYTVWANLKTDDSYSMNSSQEQKK